jgi:2Fe-2S ferredoxin
MNTQTPSLAEAEKPLEIDRGAAAAPKLIVTDRAGAERTIEGVDGLSVMEIIRNSGADEPFALCGGNCSCATCHVYVDAAFSAAIPQIGADESGVLDGSDHRRETSRLSCQILFQNKLNGLRVEIAPAD